MITASSGRRRRAPAFDLSAYQSEAEAFSAELGEARIAATGTGTVSVASIYGAHASLFTRDAVAALDRLSASAKTDAGQAAALRGFAAEGFAESQVVDLTDRIAAAEATAVILWRGERIGYRVAPQHIADMSERSERNALDASYREAVEAINPLRMARFEALRAARAELGYDDPFAMNEAARGIGSAEVLSQMQRFLVESETVYFAALRRFLAEIDIEQGDASIADLWHVLRGRGWDAWFIGRRLQSVVAGTFGALGIDIGSQPGLSLDVDSDAPREAAAVGVRVPGEVRVVVGQAGGYGDYVRLLRALGEGVSLANASADAPAAYRVGGDDSVSRGYGWAFESLVLEPDWLQTELGMTRDELVPWLDFAAFVQLHAVRRTIAGVLYEERLHGPGGTELQRAYYSGTMSLLTGVRHPESSYLADAPDHLAGIRRFRGWCFGSSLADWLRQQHGPSWWRSEGAGQELRQGWSRARALNAEALVAHLGYDQLDWRPVLRQIRTRLIGEMSGYGGPNITTRAGTRKV